MTSKQKTWVLGVSGTVAGSIFCFFLLMWWGHFEATAQTARTAEENAARAAEHEETQERLISIVEGLKGIHDAETAALEKVASLCRAGKLTDCDECGGAGVELERCL
jgi:hypothetical protein